MRILYLLSSLFVFYSFSVHADNHSLIHNTLTIYTYDSFVSDWGPGPKIKKIFDLCSEFSSKSYILSKHVACLEKGGKIYCMSCNKYNSSNNIKKTNNNILNNKVIENLINNFLTKKNSFIFDPFFNAFSIIFGTKNQKQND